MRRASVRGLMRSWRMRVVSWHESLVWTGKCVSYQISPRFVVARFGASGAAVPVRRHLGNGPDGCV